MVVVGGLGDPAGAEAAVVPGARGPASHRVYGSLCILDEN
jgi:hypothetical protein